MIGAGCRVGCRVLNPCAVFPETSPHTRAYAHSQKPYRTLQPYSRVQMNLSAVSVEVMP